MLIVNLGPTEIVILLIVLLSLAVPIVAIAAVVVFLARRKSRGSLKKSKSCAYTSAVDAKVCQFCGKELTQ